MFLVQGEGRGHMTQAMQLYKILKSNGHEVVHTFIGKSNRRKIPSYFYENMNDFVEELISPNFVLDKNNKSLNLTKTIFFNARYLGTYYRSLSTIHEKVKSLKPDVIVNFYDFLGGFYFLLFRP
jgi:UDP:flavonoid glycosyltransferase YjiC (YdhE family)